MIFSWSTEATNFREHVETFAQKELCNGLEASDKNSVFDRKLWEKCGEQLLPGLCVSQDGGGAGISVLEAAYIFEGFGKACRNNGLNFSLLAHLVAVAHPVATFGNAAQKSKWLKALCEGISIGAHAMTETSTGSDAFGMKTTAKFSNGSFILNGVKTFSTNAPVADVAIVFAVSDVAKGVFGGITAFLVDLKTPGVSRGQHYEKMGLRTSPLGELIFENVKLSEADVLGKVGMGFAIFTHTMNLERSLLFASHCGAMQRVLNDTILFAKGRQQFGQPISKFQAISHQLADLRTKQEAARLLAFQAASLFEKKGHRQIGEIAMAKLFISETYVETTRACLQIHGGYGYMTESGIEREHRDALASTIYSGTSEIQKNMIASWMGL